MELEGLVDRSKLYGFSGKTRKPQMELAEKLGIKEYPSPAGGCSLTEPNFAARLKDLYTYDKENTSVHDIQLLRVGRHFRLSDKVKVVSSRNADEYKVLKELITDDMLVFDTAEHKGSTIVLKASKGHEPTDEEIEMAAAIAARYSKGKDEETVLVKYKKPKDEQHKFIRVKPASEEEIKKLML